MEEKSKNINIANQSSPLSSGEGVGGEANGPSPLERGLGVRLYIKIGIAGPVGSGKTALIERLITSHV